MNVFLFSIVSDALRSRYRISKQHYTSFYKDIIQETLAGCLYNEGPRKKKKQVIEQQKQTASAQNSRLEQQPVSTVMASSMTTESNNYEN